MTRIARLLLPAALPAALRAAARPAAAPVGHDPARSPYRDLRFGQFLGATAGWFGGSGGQIGLAPHRGVLYGLRYDFLAERTVTIGAGVSTGELERLVVDPDAPAATRTTGPVGQRVTILEGHLQFNLTGGKSWRRLAPFVSGSGGLLLGGNVPEDTGDFEFKTKLTFTPGIGTRVFLSERLFLRLEARAVFYQVKYPDSYFEVPANAPGEDPVLLGQRPKEWITSGWYQVGLHYAFYRPF